MPTSASCSPKCSYIVHNNYFYEAAQMHTQNSLTMPHRISKADHLSLCQIQGKKSCVLVCYTGSSGGSRNLERGVPVRD